MKFGLMSVTTFVGIAYLLLLSTDNCSGGSVVYLLEGNYSVVEFCGSEDRLCWLVVGIGVTISVLHLGLLICCVVVTCLAVKGFRHYMKNSPFSVVAGGQHDTEQSWNNQQPHRVQPQQLTGHAHIDPQYATVDNESDMPTAHYFELEKPTETESRAMRMGASLSTLPSQQECNAQTQVPTVTYDELTGPGHTKKSNSSKASAASLPLQYSSIEKVNSPDEEQVDEPIPIYSMPDKSKKKKAKEKQEGEMKKSRSITMGSYGGEEPEPERTPSPPPPLLPPKPGQNEVESLYSEASSKPMRKANTMTRRAPAEIPSYSGHGLAMGTVGSPRDQRANIFHSQEDIQRSFSLMDHAKIAQAPQPTNTEQCQPYDMPLDLFLSYRAEGQRVTDKSGSRL